MADTAENRIVVRRIREGEKAEVQRVMRRAFAVSAWLFFSWSEGVLVAEVDGRIVGGAVLQVLTPDKRRKVGFFSWIFTDPEARGLGAGQALVEAGLAFFEGQGCTEIAACIEGYNSSSFKLFSTRGLAILSPGEQLRRYGRSIVPLWLRAFHFMDVGHFWWASPGPERPDSPVLQWVGTLLVNALLLWLGSWRQRALDLAELWIVPVALLVLFGLRTLAMWAAARAHGLAVRFRAWESSVPLVAAIALVFGGYLPFPGSLYPKGDHWRYRELLPKLGPMALAGSLAVLVLTGGSWAALRWDLAPALAPVLLPLYQLGRLLGLLDTVAAAFPLTSFNGRRLWDWHRPVWGIVSIAAVALFLMPAG